MEINKTSFKLFNLKGIIKSFLTSCQTYLINLPYKDIINDGKLCQTVMIFIWDNAQKPIL